jgi:tetratricopeptide (TPR) repeat protein
MTDNRVLFLSVPESLRGQIDDNFSIDPEIPIPVEIPEGEETLNLEELSWEMIISGMLRVIAEGKENNNRLNYYRCFVLAVRPSIMNEFTEADILKARNGDFDLALEILNSLRGLFPFSPTVALNRALVMEERASALERHSAVEAEAAFEAAQAAYTEALAIGSEGGSPFPDTSFNAGFFYMGRKDFRRAKECFSLFIDMSEDSKKIEQAQSIIKDIDSSGLEDESFSDAYQFIQQGNEEAGMRSIREFIERYPEVWNGWFILGWALRRLSRWQDAAAAFGKALELGGTGSDTRNELAICLMELGDLSGARLELETALRSDSENVKIISNLGVLALKSGNKDEAAAFFRTVLEIDPEDPVAKQFAELG